MCAVSANSEFTCNGSVISIGDGNLTVVLPLKFEDKMKQFIYEMGELCEHKIGLIKYIHHSYCKCQCGQYQMLVSDKHCLSIGIDDKLRLFFLLRLHNLYKNMSNQSKYASCKTRVNEIIEKTKELTKKNYGLEITDKLLDDLAHLLSDGLSEYGAGYLISEKGGMLIPPFVFAL